MVYHDFDLLIDRSGEGLRAQVLNSPAGQASAEFRLPFSEDKLENYLLRLGRTRRGTRRVESQEMNTAKAFGAALFDAVFSAGGVLDVGVADIAGDCAVDVAVKMRFLVEGQDNLLVLFGETLSRHVAIPVVFCRRRWPLRMNSCRRRAKPGID